MPRNGSGTYTRPQSDYTPGTTILATSVNSDLNDMAQALTASIARDGQTIPTADMPMGNFKHTGVADGTARTDYAALGQTQNGAFLWGGTAGGTANALTVSLNPPLAAYAAGQVFRFISSAANTGSVTLNVNSLGAVAVNKGDGTIALSAGDLPASAIVTVVHDGTRFRVLDPTTDFSWYILEAPRVLSAVSQADFLLPIAYRRYRLTVQDGVVNTAGQGLLLRFSSNGGATFLAASNYVQVGNVSGAGPGNSPFYSTTSSSIALSSTLPSGTSNAWDATFDVNPGSASLSARVRGSGIGVNSIPEWAHGYWGGAWGGASARMNALRLFVASGTFSGTVILEGMR